MHLLGCFFLFTLLLNLNVKAIDLSCITYHKSQDTLQCVLDLIERKQKGVYLRFGDGDVNLALGESDMLQNCNRDLQKEMREAFAINGAGVLKSLFLNCKEFGGYEEGMFPGKFLSNYDMSLNILRRIAPFWGASISDVYTHTALHFAATDCPRVAIDFLKRLRDSNCVLLVGNEKIPNHIIKILFGEKCQFVHTPSQQSYAQIDRIERDCLDILHHSKDYQVVILAMGCSGRVLQKRLWKQVDNVFLFDFGSLMDALCGWNTRAWIELTDFNEKKFLSMLIHNVHIICTAALIDEQFESRAEEYKNSMKMLLHHRRRPYIVEACFLGNRSFLNDICGSVYYSKTNNIKLKNKGVNEAISFLSGLEHFNFQDEDMIIKLTGRYLLESDQFINEVEMNPDVDAFIKYDDYGQVITGCFAMRCKYLKDMLRNLNFEKMEHEMINIELEVSKYLEKMKHVMRVRSVSQLGVVANIFGDGKRMQVRW